jgi:hypothetical protein
MLGYEMKNEAAYLSRIGLTLILNICYELGNLA